MDTEKREGLLSSFRGLDLSDDKGMFCGKILADFGADVIKVEKPGGDEVRRLGPFYHDIPDPEKSLFWFAYNTNKRSITLNIETAAGQEIFKKLIERVDFVIESFPVGYMASLGLHYSVLSKINSGLVMTSISPFGQDGPYQNYKGPDIVVMGMGGYVYCNGHPDRPPVRISFPQAYFHASAEAAVGTMLALYWRETTGEGQYVDVSAQQSVVLATANIPLFWEFLGGIVKREGASRMTGQGMGTPPIPVVWPCRDGFVSFMIHGGRIGARADAALIDWMDEEGMADDYLKSMDWVNWNIADFTQEEFDHMVPPIRKFFLTHTKAELDEGALKRGLHLYPVSNLGEVIDNPQLEARGFWEQVEHPELNTRITYPGATIKCSEGSNCISRRAPLIGEHNEEVYMKELGLSSEEIILLKQGGSI